MPSPDTAADKGTKRASEEQNEEKKPEDPANGDQTGPPPAKMAKPNPSSAGVESSATPPAAAGGEPVVAAKAEGGKPTDCERVEAEALQSLGLAVGTRLEVMWLLEDDEKSVEKVRSESRRSCRLSPVVSLFARARRGRCPLCYSPRCFLCIEGN